MVTIIVQTESEYREYQVYTMDQVKRVIRWLDTNANLINVRTEQTR